MASPQIMLINWAPIWEGANIGGGVNLYCQKVGLELIHRGCHVAYAFSGFTYNLIPFSHLHIHKPWQQIQSFEIVNSPCLAPGRDNFRYPEKDLKNRTIIKLFRKILNVVKPAVVHFNNIEGFCGECIHLAREKGARVIFSLHNYYTVCPQVALLFKDEEICYDYQDGLRCYNCVPNESYFFQRNKRALKNILGDSIAYSFIRSLSKHFNSIYRNTPQGTLKIAEQKETDCVSDQTGTQQRKDALKWVDASLPREVGPLPEEKPEIHSLYKLRRNGLISALNECHAVLAVSQFVARKFIQMGIKPELVKVNHIGSSIGQLVEEYRKRVPTTSTRFPSVPLRFIFIGHAGSYKGLPVLLKALEKLPACRLAVIDLFIYAQHVESLVGRIEALRPKLAGLHIHNGYRTDQLPSILKDKDIGVVPPIWWDPAPQVVMELLANEIPVIGANIGGIPDFVQTGVNGLLFQPGHSGDLAAKICYVLDNPLLLVEWRSQIQPIKNIKQHVDELLGFYGL